MDEQRPGRPRECHGPLFEQAARILYCHDPAGLARCGAPPDEYEPEASTIVPRLRTAGGIDDVMRIVHEELAQWFTARMAGDPARHAALAAELWKAHERHAATAPAADIPSDAENDEGPGEGPS